MKNDRLGYLLERYRVNSCTREELEELFQLAGRGDEHVLLPALHAQWEQCKKDALEAPMAPVPGTDWDALFRSMMDQTREIEPPAAPGERRGMRLKGRRRWLVAATGLFFLVGGGAALRFFHRPATVVPRSLPVTARRFKNDVQPGCNKAILTLADGSSIVLDSAGNGTLTTQGNTRILKLSGGSLAYQRSPGASTIPDAGPVFNTISTPRGGQYQVVLPDGSKVWLDASSSLRFPTAFGKDLREVQLVGEAYFEVAPNPGKPFRVRVMAGPSGKGEELQHVEVLGTQFNIMAYTDESAVKTTLVEGAVRVGAATGVPVQLKPNDQAQLLASSGLHVVDDADVDAAVAWKNGYFDFNKANIETIMRQLARWYDVEVSFRGNGGRDRLFYGGIQRNLPLTAVFEILERSGVQFSIDGKKVVVDL